MDGTAFRLSSHCPRLANSFWSVALALTVACLSVQTCLQALHHFFVACAIVVYAVSLKFTGDGLVSRISALFLPALNRKAVLRRVECQDFAFAFCSFFAGTRRQARISC